MKRIFLYLIAFIFTIPIVAQNTNEQRAQVMLETSMGNIEIALYNETPLTRDNFIKLVKMKFYDGLLFHRTIKDFMIQSGDPKSKNAQPGQVLGETSLAYTIPAEFRFPLLHHKRGAVAMAREDDSTNPNRASSSCQFYIVWGKVFDDNGIARVQEKLDADTISKIKLTDDVIKDYKTIGGVPHLDGQYTVFGEVIKGLDIVDKIQSVKGDANNRPLEDIRIIKAYMTKDLPISNNNSTTKRKVAKRLTHKR